MIPRKPTEADCEFWGEGATVGPMMGRHVGAADIEVVRHPDGRIRVPWVIDERDDIHGLREGLTVWTTFWGGMLPTDAVIYPTTAMSDDAPDMNPVCRQCDDGLPVVAEIDGRVLVCAECRDDAELQASARSEYR